MRAFYSSSRKYCLANSSAVCFHGFNNVSRWLSTMTVFTVSNNNAILRHPVVRCLSEIYVHLVTDVRFSRKRQSRSLSISFVWPTVWFLLDNHEMDVLATCTKLFRLNDILIDRDATAMKITYVTKIDLWELDTRNTMKNSFLTLLDIISTTET